MKPSNSLAIVILAALLSFFLGGYLGARVGYWVSQERFLRLVAVAFCPYDHFDSSCTLQLAPRVERVWFYRPSLDACIEMAEEIIAKDERVATGLDFARIYCPRAEAWAQAYSTVRANDLEYRPERPRF